MKSWISNLKPYQARVDVIEVRFVQAFANKQLVELRNC